MVLKTLKLLPLKTRLAILLLTIALVFGNIWYLHFTWHRYEQDATLEAVRLSESLCSLLPVEHIFVLNGQGDDVQRPEYIHLKKSLTTLVEANKSLSHAYLYGIQNSNAVVLAGSQDFYPPGHILQDPGGFSEPFLTGKTKMISLDGSSGDRVSAMVPFKDDYGNIIAVFVLDFTASEWYGSLWMKMIPEYAAVIIFLLLYFTLIFSWMQHYKLKSLNKRLSIDEVFYRTVFEQAPIGIAIMRGKSHTVKTELGDLTINPAYQKALGRSKEELQNLTWVELTHTDDLERDLDKFEQFKKGEICGYSMEKRYIRPDGSIVWGEITISNLSGYNEDNIHLCLLKDITEQKKAQEALKEKDRRESVILYHLPGMAYRCKYDRQWTIEYVSHGCYNLTGYPPESLLGNRDLSFNDVISEEYRELLWDEWARVVPLRLPFRYEYEIVTAGGERKWVLELGQGVYDENGEVEALEGIILDISDRKKFEDNLKYLNEHDMLTGSFNRKYLEQLIEKDYKKPDDTKRALIGINLSTVQLLTANYGFQYTQNLIKKAAELLESHCRDNAMLFKTYENRFVYYIRGYKNSEELSDFAEEIAASLENEFSSERVGGAIGILEIDPKGEHDIDILLKRLLIASEKSMNAFERDFKICVYDDKLESMVERENEIIHILSGVASGESEDEFYLQYQPIIDVNELSIYGFEALARLNSKKLGRISPLEFIPIAERTKLIVPVGKRIIRSALGFLKKLNEKGHKNIIMSINISAIELLRPDFCDTVLGIVEETGVNPSDICIEITESIFSSDYTGINNVIGKLRSHGIQLAIDDFGTGYSSLAREKELKVNCLKVDKYFIDKLLEINADKAITADIISMAHKLGHCTVAEGVEHIKQLQYLKRCNCDKAQGYLISKPLDEDKAIDFIGNYKVEFWIE